MNRRSFLIAGALSAIPLAAAAQSEHATYSGKKEMPDTGGIDPKTDPRVVAVTSTLACNCGTCPHEPVNVCTCQVAARMRAEVAQLVSQGKGATAREEMIERYGYGIVAAPPFSGLNLIAWIGPFILIGVVAAVLWAKLGDWKKTSKTKLQESNDAVAKKPDGGAQDPYLARIEAELRRGDT